MDNPRRLLDGSGTELERRLLQELRSYRGSNETRKRTLAALALTGSAGLSMAGAFAWAKTSGAKLLVGLSAASAMVAVPVGYFWSRHHGASPPPITVTRRPAVAPSSTPAVVLDGDATPATVRLAAPPEPAPAAVGRASKRSANASSASGLASSSSLSAEVDALDAVRASLLQRDFPAALTLLERYFRTFRHGRLHLEAEVLRIDALARAGEGEAARAAAKSFLRRHPKSVHAARLQSLLDD